MASSRDDRVLAELGLGGHSTQFVENPFDDVRESIDDGFAWLDGFRQSDPFWLRVPLCVYFRQQEMRSWVRRLETRNRRV